MTIASGTRLGHYEIQASIGAGGMGEVYRAVDSRLGRTVAIKVLSGPFTNDQDRLRRFEQEARATSHLNHPNIISIFDVGTFEGIPYVVEELLEGESLRQRLKEGPITGRRTIDYAIQITHGLRAAHDQGIVHRDLKPDNLFLVKDGRIKILDFGLAKWIITASEQQSNLETLANGGTRPGMILGTVGYLSPEQVKGQPVDHRADIFSFGIILYEMFTGQNPFLRSSAVETMNAILKEDPPDLALSPQKTPPAADRVIKHCLEKKPEQRFQSAQDLGFALETLSDASQISITLPASQPSKINRSFRIFWILPVFLLGLLAGLYFFRSHPMEPSFQRLTFQRGIIHRALFTPDGGNIVYSASWNGKPFEIFITHPGTPESRSLDLAGAELLSLSPEGEILLLRNVRPSFGFTYTGTLSRISLAGGEPRDILENAISADWNPKSGEVAAVRGLNRLEYPIGKVLYQSPGWISTLRFSPDGKAIAFLEHPNVGDNFGSVALWDFEKKRSVLTADWNSLGLGGLAWSPDATEVFFSGGKVTNLAQVFAVNRKGKVRQISRMVGNINFHDYSPKGEILMSTVDARRGIMVKPPAQTEERDLSWFDWSVPLSVSNDGQFLLFMEQGSGAGESYATFLRKMDGSGAVRLADGSAGDISPDGKMVVATSYPASNKLLLIPTGAGQVRELPAHGITHYVWPRFLSDQEVIFGGRKEGNEDHLFRQKIDGGEPQVIFPEPVSLPWVPSTGGTKIAVYSSKDSMMRVYFVSGGKEQPLNIPGLLIPFGWNESDTVLFVTKPGETKGYIYQYFLETGELRLWKQLAPPDRAGIDAIDFLTLTPDEQAYAYSYRRILSDLYLAQGLN